MGGCRHSICMCPTPVRGGLALTRNVNLKKHIDIRGVSCFCFFGEPIFGSFGLNGVVVDRHRLILKDDEAKGSRKVSGYLSCLWDAI